MGKGLDKNMVITIRAARIERPKNSPKQSWHRFSQQETVVGSFLLKWSI